MQPLDHGLWRAGAHDDAVPDQQFITRHARFVERRNFRKRPPALRARDAKIPDAPRLYMRQRRNRIGTLAIAHNTRVMPQLERMLSADQLAACEQQGDAGSPQAASLNAGAQPGGPS